MVPYCVQHYDLMARGFDPFGLLGLAVYSAAPAHHERRRAAVAALEAV